MSDSRPNILLITTDQQRFDSCGRLAPSFMRTPHFDHLCREGVRFDSAYADSPICVAARTAIMTGKYVFNHGLAGNAETSTIMGREGTLPTVLREQGYQTCAVGKMHFGPERARHGFDEMILPADYYREMARSGSPLQPMRHGLGQNELYPTMATVPESQTLTNWIAQQCVEYVRVRRDPTAPLFLWCSFSKPHPPLDPPEPYYSMYRQCDIPEPFCGDWVHQDTCPAPFRRQMESWSLDLIPPEIIREARAAYYGLITQIDYNMGRVFAALQDLDLFQDTLVLYTSDHGELLGDHNSGCKIFFHEPSAHVPFVLRLPQSWDDRRHGTVSGDLVTHADILPTLLTAAGGAPEADVDGVDLTALARGALDSSRDYLEATMGGSYWGITDGTWKYMFYPEGGAEQLFNVQEDPQELHDCARDPAHDAVRRKFREEMIRRHESRASGAVRDGDMAQHEEQSDSVIDRRNTSWPGYHTEDFSCDVRH